jgi:hypothetical protein
MAAQTGTAKVGAVETLLVNGQSLFHYGGNDFGCGSTGVRLLGLMDILSVHMLSFWALSPETARHFTRAAFGFTHVA